MRTAAPPCVRFIQFSFFDARTDETVSLGGLGHVSIVENDAAWADVQEFAGSTCFQADCLDGQRNTIDERSISSETCEAMLGQPIATLMARGRARFAAKIGRPSGHHAYS